MNKKKIEFLFIFILIIASSCKFSKAIQPNEESLKIRINKFYSYFQNENYEKLIEFSATPIMNKEYAVRTLKENYQFKVISYKIDSITRLGELDAKVKMITKYLQGNEEFIEESVDCWTFKNGNWYINDFGRDEDWECEERKDNQRERNEEMDGLSDSRDEQEGRLRVSF